MKFKIAKSGTIHMQQSMFPTDERDVPPPPEDAEDVPTQAEYDEETAKAQALEDYGKTPHPDDFSAPDLIVSAEVGYEAMMDALLDNIDPLMVEVETDCGARVRLCSCTVRGLGGVLMSVYDLLKLVRMDRQDEILAEREEDAEPLPTDDWSM